MRRKAGILHESPRLFIKKRLLFNSTGVTIIHGSDADCISIPLISDLTRPVSSHPS